EWCTDHKASVVKLVIGPGGVGKTRLGHELARRMQAAGWDWLPLPQGSEQEAAEILGEYSSNPLLVIVDYAEARHPSALADLLASASRSTRRVRILLLARPAGSWWHSLSAANSRHPDAVDALTVDANVI